MRGPFRLGVPIPVTTPWPRPEVSKGCLETYKDLKETERDLKDAQEDLDRLEAEDAPVDQLREAGGRANDLTNKRDRLKREWDEECVPYPFVFYVQPYHEMIEELEEPGPPGGILIPAVEPPPVPPGPPGFFPPGPGPDPIMPFPLMPAAPPPLQTPTETSYYPQGVQTWGKRAGLFRAAMSLTSMPVSMLSGPEDSEEKTIVLDKFLAEEVVRSIDLVQGRPHSEWALEDCWRKLSVRDAGRLGDLRGKLTAFLGSQDTEFAITSDEYALLEEALECRERLISAGSSEKKGRLESTAAMVGIAGGLAGLIALLW